MQSRSSEGSLLLASVPPSSGQTRLACAIAIVFLLASATLVLLPEIQLRRVDAFVPIFQTAIFFNDLITAVLLYSQFVIAGRRALLILSSGYLFSALMIIPYTLTFPGVFAPTGLPGAGLQSAAWLYFLSHAGLPLAVIAYAFLKDQDETVNLVRPTNAVVFSVAIVIGMVIGGTLLCTVGEPLLPRIMLDSFRVNLEVRSWYWAPIQLLSGSALVILFLRRRSMLDLWLCVMCLAWVIEVLLATANVTVRFSVTWYGSRIFALAAAITVLIVLLAEMATLHANLALSAPRRRQASEMRQAAMDTMAASIAHEIRQPLAAIVLNTDVATAILSRPAPDVDEARSVLRDVSEDAHRASQVIDGVRRMFKKDLHERALLDPNDVIRDALALTNVDLRMQHISTAVALRPGLPRVLGHRGQLRQVMLNLIFNAAEAMRDVEDRPRVLHLGSDIIQGKSDVVIAVADSGGGVDEKDVDRIFEPFFTTKPNGTGVGLSICRSIIEAHGGQLMASPNIPFGMVFRIVLPVQAD